MRRIALTEVPNMGSFADAIMHAAYCAPKMNVGGQSSAKKLLTTDEANQVRRLFNTNKWTVAALAREWGVSQTQIRGIVG